MIKKYLTLLIAAALLLTALGVSAEEPDTAYESLAVGTVTAFRGNFLGDMWGNSTSDLDVRALLHGYSLSRWQHDIGSFVIDDSVVSGIFVTENAQGDRSYHISLYNDLYFSDGTPITAADYAFTLLLETAPEALALGANIAGRDCFEGAVERRWGLSEVFAGVRVLGEKDLSLTIRHEYLPSFYELGMLDVTPLPISVIAPGCEVADEGQGAFIRNIEEYRNDAPRFTAKLLRETLLDEETGYITHATVVSGPYCMTAFDGRRAEFELNPYFKGDANGRKPMIKTLSYELTTNDEMIARLESGELNLINKVTSAAPLTAGMALIGQGNHRMSNYARTGASFFSFSCERIATGEASVRRAIAHAIDRDTLVRNYTGSFGLRIDGYYGIGQWMFEMINGTIAPPLPEDEAEAEAEQALWDKLTMDDVPKYEFDTDAAVRELIEGGWTLNAQGAPFDPETDEFRCKRFTVEELTAQLRYDAALAQGGIEAELDGEACVLMPLKLELIYPAGNVIEADLPSCVIDPLASIGIAVEARPVAMDELLSLYYRATERDCDIIYLATNFAKVFDPSQTFSPDDAFAGVRNRNGIIDGELYELAVAMRNTEPGQLRLYCETWLKFQQRYQEVMPALGVYSNAYFDFYIDLLQDYNITQDMSWAQAVVGAYLSDALPEEDDGTETFGIGGTASGATDASFGFEDIEFEDDGLVEFD